LTTRARSSVRHAPHALLQAYACGAMGPASSAAMSIHATHCPDCAARIGELNAVGGALLDSEEAADLDVEAALSRAMARLDERDGPPIEYAAEVMEAPEALRPAYAAALERGRWSYSGPGLRTLDLVIPGADGFGERPQLLRIEPGFGAPRHTHGAIELTLVLDGAFRDETGVYGPGDLAVASDTLTHRPVAEPGRTCFAYAVSHAPMRFKGLFGVAQRLLTGWRQ
jgi:putative transcriptional regulator